MFCGEREWEMKETAWSGKTYSPASPICTLWEHQSGQMLSSQRAAGIEVRGSLSPVEKGENKGKQNIK
jgi:hypothetical protein